MLAQVQLRPARRGNPRLQGPLSSHHSQSITITSTGYECECTIARPDDD
jgi:hypothetical protein